ncbi:unnamed protein product [Polarella glacialis]|uniref:Uncharacterized protein n=1 Tax=Polarella glacialis TaxID=89957 RepID=A0A813EEE1_POLGL|nr:unnamed protein product [Polarella glacialis]
MTSSPTLRAPRRAQEFVVVVDPTSQYLAKYFEHMYLGLLLQFMFMCNLTDTSQWSFDVSSSTFQGDGNAHSKARQQPVPVATLPERSAPGTASPGRTQRQKHPADSLSAAGVADKVHSMSKIRDATFHKLSPESLPRDTARAETPMKGHIFGFQHLDVRNDDLETLPATSPASEVAGSSPRAVTRVLAPSFDDTLAEHAAMLARRGEPHKNDVNPDPDDSGTSINASHVQLQPNTVCGKVPCASDVIVYRNDLTLSEIRAVSVSACNQPLPDQGSDVCVKSRFRFDMVRVPPDSARFEAVHEKSTHCELVPPPPRCSFMTIADSEAFPSEYTFPPCRCGHKFLCPIGTGGFDDDHCLTQCDDCRKYEEANPQGLFMCELCTRISCVSCIRLRAQS